MDQIQFLFFDPTTAHWQLKLQPNISGTKMQKFKVCQFFYLNISINQLVNKFGRKIINFQNLAFNGLITITCSKATKHVIVIFSSRSKPTFSHVSKLISQFNTLTSQRRQFVYDLNHEIICKKNKKTLIFFKLLDEKLY